MRLPITFIAILLLIGCSDKGKFSATTTTAISPPQEEEPQPMTDDAEVEVPDIPTDLPADEVGVDMIPGEPVIRLGINFEDTLGGDDDYNDAVLCFEGQFRVNGTSIISSANQEVVATTSSISGCRHNIEVLIIHADGTSEEPYVFDSKEGGDVQMNFVIGDKLDVTMIPTYGCVPGSRRSMSDPLFAKILPNVCNTTGK